MKKRTKYIVFYLSAIIGLIISWFKPTHESPLGYLWAWTLLILGLNALVFLILTLIPTNKREKVIARAEVRKELENYGGFGSLRGGMFN
ncbi:MAG: hypothetical protein K2J12_01735 [Muribaculaceae bacterium]|nr:hypothetical protein [Muribaculaceae bacterium]